MSENETIALIAVTATGLDRARQLRARLKTGEIYRPSRYGPARSRHEHLGDGPLADLVPDLFARFDHLVFFLAAGAATRLIAPSLGSKATDPGVLVVDEGGTFVVPILSGHEGGANDLARTVAGAIGAVPVITTGSEAGGGFNLAAAADAAGWVAEPAGRFKEAARAFLDRSPVAIIQELSAEGTGLDRRALPAHVDFATAVADLPRRDFAAIVWITDRVVADLGGLDEAQILWYRPPSLVLGVGCERGITAAALADGVDRVLREHGLAVASVALVASLDLKADEAGLIELATRRGWPTAFHTAEELADVPGVVTPSAVVAGCVGTPGVAEPAALRSAGTETLLVVKQILTSDHSPRRMTIALARRAEYRPREAGGGHVVFIGAGPGDPDLLTVKADQLIRRADIVVYAGSLVPEGIVRRAPAHAALHNSAHLTLEETNAVLVAGARAGKAVVRLQSGDPGLYSATQEQMTLLDEAGVSFEIVPGISAYQVAAAVLKSELTIPAVAQTVILTRGEGNTPMPAGEDLVALAAHRATLCLFLSAGLAEQVQGQLLTAYPPETPTAILYRVSWPDEKIIVTTLAHLATEIRTHRLTRTTLIMVGQAIGGRQNRSQLYNKDHGHIFRKRAPQAQDTPAERHVGGAGPRPGAP